MLRVYTKHIPTIFRSGEAAFFMNENQRSRSRSPSDNRITHILSRPMGELTKIKSPRSRTVGHDVMTIAMMRSYARARTWTRWSYELLESLTLRSVWPFRTHCVIAVFPRGRGDTSSMTISYSQRSIRSKRIYLVRFDCTGPPIDPH